MGTPLESDKVFHVYNRANGDEKLFRERRNYDFFLTKLQYYLLPVVQIYSYCLMPNHFHLLLRIRSKAEIASITGPEAESKLNAYFVSKAFSNFFSCYTQAFNKVYKRKGSLFIKNFKRKQVGDEIYYRKLVYYIHLNPVVARMVRNPEDWAYSSYGVYLENRSSFIETAEVLELFGGLENFRHCHEQPPDLTGIDF